MMDFSKIKPSLPFKGALHIGEKTYLKLLKSAFEIAALSVDGDVVDAVKESVDPLFLGDERGDLPDFLSIDFAQDTNGEFRLIELQAFPSIAYFYFSSARGLCDSFDGLEQRESLMMEVTSESVIVDIFNSPSRSWIDFKIAQEQYGMDVIDIRQINRVGDDLYFKGTKLTRIYNRAILNELTPLELANLKSVFVGSNVQWINHPDWFLLVSKRTMIHIKHPSVVACGELNENSQYRDDYVVKPFDQYGGFGVELSPSEDRFNYLKSCKKGLMYQERIDYGVITEGIGDFRVMLALTHGKYSLLGVFFSATVSKSDRRRSDFFVVAP